MTDTTDGELLRANLERLAPAGRRADAQATAANAATGADMG
jgi:hypothetical protein